MRFSLSILMLGVVGLIQLGGCSVSAALSQPPYVDFKKGVQLGQPKLQVNEVIRHEPKVDPETHVALYQFTSGTPGASRVRVVGYIAGDVFTICLAEAVFWPTELSLLKAQTHRAYATFDGNGQLTWFRVVNEDGKVEYEVGTRPPAWSRQAG